MFPTRSDTNWPALAQKMAGGWKFWIYKEEKLHYPCSENKGADQLCKADLRLCFRPSILLVSPCGSSFNENIVAKNVIKSLQADKEL